MGNGSSDGLRAVSGESFVGVPDKAFTSSDMGNDGFLHVSDCFPGGITVIDNEGRAVMPEQREHVEGGRVTGVDVNLNGFEVHGEWKIRYARGMRGAEGLAGEVGEVSSDELFLYSLILS